jgi:outer membrane PBP1 activator LpoA protein
MSGKYSKIANVIYAGILSAKELNEDERYDPEIVLYDTGVQNQNILEHYQLAIDQGAEYVIGPLDKEAVETLSTQADISVPTLTLNYLPDHIDTPSNLYQFGLLPEDEAIQVAQRTFMDGHQRTLILSAQGDWQSRLTDTFINHYEELGGQVLDTQYYMTNNSDFSETLKDVLHITESEQRYQQLRASLGVKIKHQARRRQDAQAIFLIAPPKTARLIRPQINYYFGTDLSVYSTSHIFSGTENITKDRDINGVTYADIPWILDPKLADEILRELLEIETGRDYKDHPRFAALGIDAYNLPMQITTLLAIQNSSYSGLAGRLSMHDNNRLYRELLWGKFVNGRPRLLKSHSH